MKEVVVLFCILYKDNNWLWNWYVDRTLVILVAYIMGLMLRAYIAWTFSTCYVSQELWPLPAEREVIRHRHLQSPLTLKYFSNSSSTLRSLLSPTLDSRRVASLHWD